MSPRWVLALALVAARWDGGAATRVSGKLFTAKCYSFMMRFSFSTGVETYDEETQPRVEYSVLGPALLTNAKFGIYHVPARDYSAFGNNAASFYKRWTSQVTCEDRYLQADCQFNLDQQSQETTTDDVARSVRHDGAFTCEAMRLPGYTYVTLLNFDANCYNLTCSGPLMNVTYDIWMRNRLSTQFAQFPADMAGVLTFASLFFPCTIALNVYAYIVRRALEKRDMVHHTVKFLQRSVMCSSLSALFYLLHFAVFNVDGQGSAALYSLGVAFHSVADLLFLLLIVVVGKGWTIVRRKISAQGRMKIAALMTLYGSTLFATQIWYDLVYTDEFAVNREDSVPGFMVLGTRGLLLLYFWYAVYVSVRKYRRKVRFYQKYIFFMTIWTASPFFFFRGGERTNLIFKQMLLAIWHLISLVLYDPSSRNPFKHSFPFHATVTQMNSPSAAEDSKKPKEGSDPLAEINDLVGRVGSRLQLLSEKANDLKNLVRDLDPESMDQDIDLKAAADEPSDNFFGLADIRNI